MALPKVIVRFTDWIGTVGVLVLCSLIFAYFLAYYDIQMNTDVPWDCEEQPQFDAVHSTPTEIFNTTEEVLVTHEWPQYLQDQVQVTETVSQTVAEESLIYRVEVFRDKEPTPFSLITDTDATEVLSPDAEQQPTAESAAELLDLAFRFKEQQDFDSAAKLFRTVLQFNRESDAAPLVIIEIADSLSHIGAYLEAIDLLEDSLTFTVVKGKTPLEFHIRAMIDNLKQLQVVT